MSGMHDAKRIAALVAGGAALAAAAALATVPRYTVIEADGQRAVHDGTTGLTWQQQSTSGMTDWKGALAHCQNLTWAGETDWRLPDIVELSTIVDDRRTRPPAINTVFFAGFEAGAGYWSSTTARTSAGSAYVLYFNEQNVTVGRGGTSPINKTTGSMRSLCIREGP
ncbi:MAG: DUF1566 domain-containing protein [Myxococcota bacterium]|nr:DUF1566 domain-containing protein [Myxococcota bacterium]